MAATWGRAEIDVDIDGRGLPRQVYALGRRAGAVGGNAMGESFNRTFSQRVRDGLRNVFARFRGLFSGLWRRAFNRGGRTVGQAFSQGFRDSVQRFNVEFDRASLDVERRSREMTRSVRDAFREFRLEFDAVGTDVVRTSREMTKVTREVDFGRWAEDIGQFRRVFREVQGDFDRLAIDRTKIEDIGELRQVFRETGDSARHLRDNMTLVWRELEGGDRTVQQSSSRWSRFRDNLRGFTTSVGSRMRGFFSNMRRNFRGADRDIDMGIGGWNRMRKASDEGGRSFGRNSRLLRSHVARTIAAWSALVLIIGEGASTLGSGVGASLTALISSLAVAVVGGLGIVGAAVAGFVAQIGLAVNSLRFMKEEVPAVKSALDTLAETSDAAGRRFANAWGPSVGRFLETLNSILDSPELIDAMAASLSKITDAFTAILQGPGFQMFLKALTTDIPAGLTGIGSGFAQIFGGLASVFAAAGPALKLFGEQFNAFWTTWQERMTAAAADGTLQEFFLKALDSINAILGAVGALGSALWTVFQAGAETGNSMLNTLTDLFTRWNEWMNTVEGQQVLAEWFANGETIFNALLDLAGDLGRALGDLVTPESVQRLVDFMDRLGEFLPIASQILSFFGRLNILGIFVELLNSIGAVLTPIMPILFQLAETIGTHLVNGIQQLAPSFTALGEALAPVLTVITVLVDAILPPLIDIIQSVIEYLASFVEALFGTSMESEEFAATVEVVGNIVRVVFEAIANIVGAVLTVIGGLLKSTSQLLRGDFSGAFETMSGVVRKVFKAFGLDFDAAIQWVVDLWNNVSRFFGRIGRALEDFGQTVADIFQGVIGWISDAINWFGSLFGAANNAAGAAGRARNSGGGNFASGGVLWGPRRILAGEAGPEAIVPLNRSLSQVDPSVRWLSAIAQGKGTSAASGGVIGGPSRVVNIEEGAIQIAAPDPWRAATETVNRIVERVVA